jgi:hypothetical protein
LSITRIAALFDYDSEVGQLSSVEVVGLINETLQSLCWSTAGLRPNIIGFAEEENRTLEIRLFIWETKPEGEDELE